MHRLTQWLIEAAMEVVAFVEVKVAGLYEWLASRIDEGENDATTGD